LHVAVVLVVKRVCEPRGDSCLPANAALRLALAFHLAVDLLEQGALTVSITVFEWPGRMASLRSRTTLRTTRPFEPRGGLTPTTA
jgi:hypothetical protein